MPPAGDASVIRLGSVLRYVRIQADDVSEDCLTINVLRPKLSSPSPLPVMAWVYGGSFLSKSRLSAISPTVNSLMTLTKLVHRLTSMVAKL